MTNPISTYVTEHLRVFLQEKELSEDTLVALTNDIEDRLVSVISRWNDADFRSTLLLVAVEEATFYTPLHDSINALVVLAVRNSDVLQDLHGTQGVLDDSEIRALTSQAIEFFAEVDLAQLSGQLEPRPNDPFGALPTKYPVAWEAVQQLALGTARFPNKTYEPQTAELHELPKFEQVVDGELLEDLMRIQNGEISFLFRDSFKMISRNIDKLYYVIEFVLRRNNTVITHNYYISDGMVARRKQLLKPAHKPTDIARKFDNKTGLVNRHKDSLRLLKKFIVPSERPTAPTEAE
ncbi:MAG: hypothetical protein WCC10_18360 [Tumebacillaceae bacterium]